METTQEGTEAGQEPVRRVSMRSLLIGVALVAMVAGAVSLAGGSLRNTPNPVVICHGAAPPRLRDAARRAGIPESEWGKLKGDSIGGVYISVNGREVPLNNQEKIRVKEVENMTQDLGY